MEKSLVRPERPHRQHLVSSKDLETTYEEIRAGFVALALERNRQATPFVEEARVLKAAASLARTPGELSNITSIQSALLTAAGVSDKATNHMQPEDKAEAIRGLIKNFLEPAGAEFVEELIFRFLLTRGDALGGSMRNIAGAIAQRKITRMIISSLSIAGSSIQGLQSPGNKWIKVTGEEADIELYLKGLSWSNGSMYRTLVYNVKLPLVRKNVDLCLLNCTPQHYKNALRLPAHYIALGELKGGIDPAGADEHWKTARTALLRIRGAFSTLGLSPPHTFFIGAAIVKEMAEEMWNELENGTLSNAANLTNPNQMASLSQWLCNL